MSITLREILEIEPFSSCQLLSGSEGLSNIVKYTTTMEMPEIKPWLRKNLLLITTGYAIKGDPEALIPLMNDLRVAGCSGLMIKKQYIGMVPQRALDLSNQYKIPIIILPDDIPFTSLFVPLMNTIFQNHDAQLQNARLLMDIITGDLSSEQEIALRAASLNWPYPPLRMIVIEAEEPEGPGPSPSENADVKQQMDKILECISSRLMFSIKKLPVMLTGNFFTVIAPDTGSKPILRDCLCDIGDEIASSCGMKIKIGVSESVTSYGRVREAYLDAKDALAIGKMLEADGFIYPIQNFRLEQFFFQYKGNAQMKKYFDSTIGVIRAYDEKNHTELLKTLSELIRCMGVKSKAAKQLYLHRNTLQYRIKKIEELIDMPLSDGDNLIRLAIILKMGIFL